MMKAKIKRFTDTGASLNWYRKEAVCVCPICLNPALVHGKFTYAWSFDVTEARVQCLQCTYNKIWNSNGHTWNGPVVGCAKQPCPQCGHRWLEAGLWEKERNPNLKQTAIIECDRCHSSSELNLTWYRDIHSNQPVDPYFGLPLWLQVETCGKIFWACNNEHLQTLKEYIAATHRDRDGKWSMLARLPQWIKSAKNREALLKAIAKLEAKLKEIKE